MWFQGLGFLGFRAFRVVGLMSKHESDFFSNKTSLKSRLSNSFVNLARQLIAIFEMDLSKYVPVVSMNVLMECSRKNWKISTTYFILQAAIPFVKDVIKKSLDKTGCDTQYSLSFAIYYLLKNNWCYSTFAKLSKRHS